MRKGKQITVKGLNLIAVDKETGQIYTQFEVGFYLNLLVGFINSESTNRKMLEQIGFLAAQQTKYGKKITQHH